MKNEEKLKNIAENEGKLVEYKDLFKILRKSVKLCESEKKKKNTAEKLGKKK